ncbi:MAG: hypothetical protein CMP11_04200 [Zetaproteobacteria bacterium]|nr:hypothetical protein [Pseudobdellovibrionaceae bacterium]|tara:strand:+ start:99 stop:599 length:501 start_codon:yes stop_codon:yes gene_type:complete
MKSFLIFIILLESFQVFASSSFLESEPDLLSMTEEEENRLKDEFLGETSYQEKKLSINFSLRRKGVKFLKLSTLKRKVEPESRKPRKRGYQRKNGRFECRIRRKTKFKLDQSVKKNFEEFFKDGQWFYRHLSYHDTLNDFEKKKEELTKFFECQKEKSMANISVKP